MIKKTIKSYTNIWRFDNILYRLGDINLPFPATYHQIGWFLFTFAFMFFFGALVPVSNPILKYLFLPIVCGWFFGSKTLDNKRPHRFILSVIKYHMRAKKTYMGQVLRESSRKKVKFKIFTMENMFLDNLEDNEKIAEENIYYGHKKEFI